MQNDLNTLCINTIRTLAMDSVQKATCGHPGMPMGMAPAGYALWMNHMKYNPRNPKWANRDRFVLSAGHGCMLLYSLLHLTGFDLSLEDLKHFRQWESKTPGHPEYGHTPGVEVTTGPLGQGVANAVGMAIAQKYLAAYFNREGFPILDYKIYVIAGDGCLQEGVSAEASSLAGHLGLDNLVLIYDNNHISIDGDTLLSFSEDVAKRYEAYGWHVQSVDGDGNDLGAFSRAVAAAERTPGRPSFIKWRTHIGYGSPHKQDTHDAHGTALGEEEIALTKEAYGWDPAKKFFVPEEALSHFRTQVQRGAEREAEWDTQFDRYVQVHPELAKEFRQVFSKRLPQDWETLWRERMPRFDPSIPLATREAQGKVLDAILPGLPMVIGGSADLTPSNNTRFKGATDFSVADRLGRYIRYGVREHAMGAIMNGIAVSDVLLPFGGTFFCFSDYMRPAIRLAALSRYPTIFVFTHDSIGLGEDGPTHQAVEQLASLRAMPGLVVLRPGDAHETTFAWKFALENRTGPTVLLLSRQKIPVLDQQKYASAVNVSRGAYVVIGDAEPALLLLATGSELHLALSAHEKLAAEGISSRVVSMPSWELFEKQPREYRESVLPPTVIARVAIEAGVKTGWERYLGLHGEFIGVSTFGASAPVSTLFQKFGLTVDNVVVKAKEVIKKRNR